MKTKKATCTGDKHQFYLCGGRKLCHNSGYQNRAAINSTSAKGDEIDLGEANESCYLDVCAR